MKKTALLLPGIVAAVICAAALADGVYSPGVVAGAALALWWLLFVALGLRLLPRDRVPRLAIVGGAALLAFALLNGISIAWADDNGAAYQLAILAALYVALFTTVVLASPRGSARRWLVGITLGLLAVCLLALVTRWFPGLESDEIARALPDAKGRLSYPIGYWNALGAMLATLVCLLGWLGGGGESRLQRTAANAALPLPMLGIYLTSSRGATLAAVLGVIGLVALSRDRSRVVGTIGLATPGGAALIAIANSMGDITGSEGAALLAVSIAAVAVVAAVRLALDAPLLRLRLSSAAGYALLATAAVAVVVAVTASDPAERWRQFKQLPAPIEPGSGLVTTHITSSTGSGRYQFWSAALDAFHAHPLIGIGAGDYAAWWTQHGSFSYSVLNAHSLFFEVLAELGIIGVSVLLAFLVIVCVAGAGRLRGETRAETAACFAIFVTGLASAAIDWTWQLAAVFGLVVVAAGLLSGPATLSPGSTTGPPASGRSWRVVAMLGALALACASALPLIAQTQIDQSQDDIRGGDLAAAEKSALAASAVEPWSSAGYLQASLVEEQRGELEAARNRINEAIAKDPRDWSLWLVAARIEAESGNVRSARAALARSRRLNPRSPVFTILGPPSQ